MSVEGEYRYVRFGTEDQIIESLTDGLKQELNPQTREIILSVINEIGHRFAGRNINAIIGHSSAKLPPDLTSGLKSRIHAIIKKELDNRQLGQGQQFCVRATKRSNVRREVCLGLRFYMNTLPTVSLAKKEKQRQASSSSSFSSSSSSSTLGSKELVPHEDIERAFAHWISIGMEEAEENT